MTAIKLCGLTREADVQVVNELKPEYTGFVFWEKSHRNLSREQAAKLKSLLDPIICCMGVFVDEPVENILDLYLAGIIDGAQLHGQESEEEIRILKDAGMQVWKAFKVKDASTLTDAYASNADMILFDPGKGDGVVFNWQLIRDFNRPYFLAGGLHPGNVAEAIRELHPYGVDVSSGIETDRRKDPDKMRNFVEEVRKEDER